MTAKIFGFLLIVVGSSVWIVNGALIVSYHQQKTTVPVSEQLTQTPQVSNQDFTQGFRQILLNLPRVISNNVPQTTPISQPISKSVAKTPTNTNTTLSTNAGSTGTGIPKTITISKLGVNAPIESVGLDTQGRMDVPKQWYTVGWYNLGFKVGEGGSAVMSGHLDTSSGAPAVFWSLGKLNPGDQFTITDTGGKVYKYRVYEKQTYSEDSLPLERIFGSSGTSGLNLITCAGSWDRNARNYSQRIVAYSQLIP